MRPYDEMNAAEKIKNLRKRTGLSQGEMAERLEVSQGLVSAWERGANLPRVPELVRLVALLGTTADYLLDDRDERSAESLAVELKVREVAERIGWEAVYDRLLSLPSPSGIPPGGRVEIVRPAPAQDRKYG